MQEEACKCPAGAPGWLATFADLMSLLMCFFVLLLSFSEMDILKFKAIADTMKHSFGVQSLVKADAIPKGTSVIAKEFSPGKPQPTLIPEVKQSTQDEFKQNLEAQDEESQQSENEEQSESEQPTEQMMRIQAALADAIDQGLLNVESKDGKTIIRIEEKGSFPSGTSDLSESFEPVIQKISDILATSSGQVHVSGHTDNIPINTRRFRSNWELASERSVTVLHSLLRYNSLDETRFTIEGLADSRPIESNDTREGRTKNRRVEITIEE
jgi:chemotaxis protein MotB